MHSVEDKEKSRSYELQQDTCSALNVFYETMSRFIIQETMCGGVADMVQEANHLGLIHQGLG